MATSDSFELRPVDPLTASRAELEQVVALYPRVIGTTREPATAAALWNGLGHAWSQLAGRFGADTAEDAIKAFLESADNFLFTISDPEAQQQLAATLYFLVKATMLPEADADRLEDVGRFIDRHKHVPPLSDVEFLSEMQAHLAVAYIHHGNLRKDRRRALATQARQLLETAMSDGLPDPSRLLNGSACFNLLTARVMAATRPAELTDFAEQAINFGGLPGVVPLTEEYRDHVAQLLGMAAPGVRTPVEIARQAGRLWREWGDDFIASLAVIEDGDAVLAAQRTHPWVKRLIGWEIRQALIAEQPATSESIDLHARWLDTAVGYPRLLAAFIRSTALQGLEYGFAPEAPPAQSHQRSSNALWIEQELPRWQGPGDNPVAELAELCARQFGWNRPADDSVQEELFVSRINAIIGQLANQIDGLRAAALIRRVQSEQLEVFSRLRLATAMYRMLARWTAKLDSATPEFRHWVETADAIAEDVIRAGPDRYDEVPLEFAYRVRAQAATHLVHLTTLGMPGDGTGLVRAAENALAAYSSRFPEDEETVHSLSSNLAYVKASRTVTALNRHEQVDQLDVDEALAAFIEAFRMDQRLIPDDLERIGVRAGNVVILGSATSAETIAARRQDLLDAASVVLRHAGTDSPFADIYTDAVEKLAQQPLHRLLPVDRQVLGDALLRLATAGDQTSPVRAASLRRTARRLRAADGSAGVDDILAAWKRMSHQGQFIDGIRLMLGWVAEVISVPSYRPGRMLAAHLATRQLGLVLHSTTSPDRVTLVYTAYLIAESARFVRRFDVSEQWFATVLAERPDDPEAAQDLLSSVRHDYAQMRIQRACFEGNASAARRALRGIAEGPEDGEDDRRLQLLSALASVVQHFGPAVDPMEFAEDVDRLLDETYDTAAVVPWSKIAPVLRGHLGIALVWPRPDTLDKLIMLCSRVLNRGLGAHEEAELLRARAYCHELRGDIVRNTRDLERITFLQDETLAQDGPFDPDADRDLVRESLVASVFSALDENSPEVAIDLAELGRARTLSLIADGLPDRLEQMPRNLRRIDEDVLADLRTWFEAALTGRATAGSLEEEWLDFDWLRSFVPDLGRPSKAVWSLSQARAGIGEAAALAAKVGIVTYQIARGRTLHLIHLIGSGVIVHTGEIRYGHSDFPARLFDSWRLAFDAWADEPTSTLQPVVIDVGSLAELPARHRRVVSHLSRRHGVLEESGQGIVSYLPTVRLAVAPDRGRRQRDAIRILHIGDDTTTLIGPWIEATAIARQSHVEVISLLGSDVSAKRFDEHSDWANIVIASCHGSFDDGDPLGTSLRIGPGLSLADIAGRSSLAELDFFFIAACNAARRGDTSHEREAFSFTTAALAAGCTWAAAPVAPVNDLASALLVIEFVRLLAAHEPAHAFTVALHRLRTCPDSTLRQNAMAAWQDFRADADLVSRLPWPVSAVTATVEARIQSLRANAVEAADGYVLFGSAARELDDR